MADFSNIIQEINDDINTNGVGAITGAKLNEVLRDMIDAVNDEKQDPLTIDATPNEDSTNPVQSGGVYDALEDKADKVSGATNGNIASFDANGNIQDSGIAASDVATTSDLADKLDAPSTAGTSGQVLTSDGQGGHSWQTPQSGVSSYNDLNDKPQINSVTLSGNKTLSQLGIQSELTFDNMPTDNSNNPVKSGGVKTALDSKQDTLVSGTSIKTVNNTSLLGSGNIQINDGVGFQTITTQQDGTMVITLTDGNTITVDLNHNHEQYTKVVICASVASYEAITNKDAMTFYIIPSVALYLGSTLVLEQGGTPLPYTPIEYIETDGNAYIDTGINGNDPRSCSLKFSTGSSGTHCILGTGSATENTSLYALAFVNTNNYLGFGHNYYYVNSNARYLITAGSPFEAKVAMTNGSQIAQLKREGDSSFESYSKTNSATLTTNKHMYLFALNDNNTGVHGKCSSGSRLYYCKIYSDNSYSTLVFDGIPCVYNGEYGLWDKKTDTFFGAVSGSGTFTGPSIS